MKKYEIAFFNKQGTRPSQQDSIGMDLVSKKKAMFAVLADGMGGLRYGDEIGKLVVTRALELYGKRAGKKGNLAREFAGEINRAVLSMLSGREGSGGATYIGVYLDGNAMYFASVGDSKLYLYKRGFGLQRLNIDHNFGRELDELVDCGKISMDEAVNNMQRHALTSYMGAEPLRLVNANDNPIELSLGDCILILSDGVTGALSEERIAACLLEGPLQSGMDRMSEAVAMENKRNQDNYSAIAIQIC